MSCSISKELKNGQSLSRIFTARLRIDPLPNYSVDNSLYLIVLFIIYIILSFEIKISLPSSLEEGRAPHFLRVHCPKGNSQLNFTILLANTWNRSKYRFRSILAHLFHLFAWLWVFLVHQLVHRHIKESPYNDEDGGLLGGITSLRFSCLWNFHKEKLDTNWDIAILRFACLLK